jgi:hypothetical protein
VLSAEHAEGQKIFPNGDVDGVISNDPKQTATSMRIEHDGALQLKKKKGGTRVFIAHVLVSPFYMAQQVEAAAASLRL